MNPGLPNIGRLTSGCRGCNPSQVPERANAIFEYASEEAQYMDIGVHRLFAFVSTENEKFDMRVETCADFNAGYFSIDSMQEDRGLEEHIESLDEFADTMGLVGLVLVGNG